jgi:transcriptional regulator with XRE-family HTH domain
MPISPSSSVQHAREQLAERLRDIRLDARLTARALSAAAGWHEAKTSRIESAKKAPSEDDIRTWCRVCGAERAIPDLVAASRSADSMYTEWRRLQPAGMRRDQENRLPLHERTKVLKAYVGTVVPGFLQTPEYATALLSAIRDFHGTPDDVADAVAVRMQRKRLVQPGSHRYIAIIEEAVLRQVIGDAEVMAGQLGYLLEATTFPTLSLGVIPFRVTGRPVWPLEAFTIFDDTRVYVELLSAQVTVTTPSEIVLYARAFEKLSGLAVYGDEARARGSRMPSALSESSVSSRKFLPRPALDQAASNYAPARLRIAGRGGQPQVTSLFVRCSPRRDKPMRTRRRTESWELPRKPMSTQRRRTTGTPLTHDLLNEMPKPGSAPDPRRVHVRRRPA